MERGMGWRATKRDRERETDGERIHEVEEESERQLLALKMEKDTMNQEIQEASRSKKKQENVFSLEASRKEHSPVTS